MVVVVQPLLAVRVVEGPVWVRSASEGLPRQLGVRRLPPPVVLRPRLDRLSPQHHKKFVSTDRMRAP
eukprot:scaffold1941_cov263-Pinguiococcus_pyrenoidosus.AAC.25